MHYSDACKNCGATGWHGWGEIHEEYCADCEGLILDGVRMERAWITKQMQDRICFDHRETAACDHQACYELDNLVAQINDEDVDGHAKNF
jgi:hypothetical protein